MSQFPSQILKYFDIVRQSDCPMSFFYYNGTTIPPVELCPDIEDEYEKMVNDKIVEALRSGYSIERQKKMYKEQLDVMEQTIRDVVGCDVIGDGDMIKIAEKMGLCVDEFGAIWSFNISALLRLKAIDYDDKNGITTANFVLKNN